MSIYLDYNSSAPIDPRVLDYMISVYTESYGNADSRTHDYGTKARQVVEDSRKNLAELMEISPTEVFFTSGATESNNIAIQGLKEYGIQTGKKHLITTSIEHKSILETMKHMEKEGFEVDYVAPREDGRVALEDIKNLVRKDTLLVSVMHINNETGIVQPVKEVGEYLVSNKILFHVDATQSFGKLVDELKTLQYDILSMSAHKIGGPQGIGALILRRKRYKLPPVKGIMYGGPQEHGIRPGTIPVALVAGLGKACEISAQEYRENQTRCREIKSIILKLLNKSSIEYQINGEQTFCVPNTLNVSFPGISSEALMLSTKQYCGISNGSACNASLYEPSYVLKEMGLSSERIASSIRISWGPQTDSAKLEQEFWNLLMQAKKL